MKAAVSRDIGQIGIEDLDDPHPRAGEVGLRMVATGVCHTDVTVLHGNMPSPRPIVLGHEGAGVVEEVGPGVRGLAVGDKVICSIIAPCNTCFQCLRGDPAMCEQIVFFTGRMLDGTTRLSRGDEAIYSLSYQASFAERAVVPEACAVKVREDAPLEKLCGLACGVSTGLGAAMVRADVRPGSSVLVIGAGGVGLSALMGARERGATRLIAADVAPSKLAKARELGLATDTVDNASTSLVEAVRELTDGRGADYSFDAVGAPGTLEQAIEAIRPGGTCVVIGRMGDIVLEIPTTVILRHKWVTGTMGGSIHPKRHIPEFVDLFMNGRLEIDRLMDREYALHEIETAFDDLEAGSVTRGVVTFP